MATAWSDGATSDCAIAYNILLHQRDQALWGVSSLGSQDERERLLTAVFGASSLFDDLRTSYSCGTRWSVGGRENALYRGSAPFAVGKHVLLHSDQYRLHPCHDGMLLCRCRPHVHVPFWPVYPFLAIQRDSQSAPAYAFFLHDSGMSLSFFTAYWYASFLLRYLKVHVDAWQQPSSTFPAHVHMFPWRSAHGHS